MYLFLCILAFLFNEVNVVVAIVASIMLGILIPAGIMIIKSYIALHQLRGKEEEGEDGIKGEGRQLPEE